MSCIRHRRSIMRDPTRMFVVKNVNVKKQVPKNLLLLSPDNRYARIG